MADVWSYLNVHGDTAATAGFLLGGLIPTSRYQPVDQGLGRGGGQGGPRRRRAGPAAADEGEMPGADLEAVAAPEVTGQIREQLGRDLDDGPAVLADEVLMDVVGQVVHRGAVTQVRVLDQAELGEGVQAPVDGGAMHVRMQPVDLGGELVGGKVSVGAGQGAQERPASGRHPLPPTAEALDQLVDPFVPHLRKPIRASGKGEQPIGGLIAYAAR